MKKVAVLLTTYNSSIFLAELLNSILNQVQVITHIFVSDDYSTDETLRIIKLICPSDRVTILPNKSKYGKPGLNFFSLVERVYFREFSYYCFADHDDIWHENKLFEGIQLLISSNSSGYSSSFHLYFDNSLSRKFVSKNPNQKKYDFIFSSPGPGCTFILSCESYSFLRQELLINTKLFTDCEYHDWAIYAFFRSNKLSWIIDNRSFIDYRQHLNNDTGANFGFKAVLKRIKLFRDRTYEGQIQSIVSLVKFYNLDLIKVFNSNNKLFFYFILFSESRRKISERLIIVIISFLGLIRKNKYILK